ncbi:hypothetical protein CYR40_13060 [Chimaeribacter arupi]|nr:hypothetical protein CYR52_21870 [Chimaeribacter arupi]PLR45299.1 hypothetical protein CYR40_13060 [Chimaeribacter arupi]
MKINKVVLIIISRIVCGVGLTLGSFGMIGSIWFFFISSNIDRFYWGGGAVFLFIIGYLIYQFGNSHIYDEWDDYY